MEAKDMPLAQGEKEKQEAYDARRNEERRVIEALRNAPIQLVRQGLRGICEACGKETDALSQAFHPGEGCEDEESNEA